jgi:arylsulfatase A-like enzyme
MKTVFILMDSLNRHYLNAYGDSRVQTPNIDRLAQRGVVFDNHYSCSMPCMPARRDLFTGRACFLESPWGPIQPWDDCLQPELRRQTGTYSHLITDHFHYFRTGGEGYHTCFDTWEYQRGQCWDPWRPLVREPEMPVYRGRNRRTYWANREFFDTENDEEYTTPQCFMRAEEFLDRNHEQDNWHLHLEVFDPHEPFICPRKYLEQYGDTWDGRYYFDWPEYEPVSEEPEAVEHIRKRYAGTLSMADHWLGKFLDKMDSLDLWKDTTVVLTTDHGHLLGEHGYWAKNYMFDYEELVHIPLIVCRPGVQAGRIDSLTSTLDLMPTFMECHGAEPPAHLHGKSVCALLDGQATHHQTVLFGYFGKDINLTNGRYTYCRQAAPDSFLFKHTAMPTGARGWFDRESLAQAEYGVFLKHAGNVPHMRLKTPSHWHHNAPDFNPIYDLSIDPHQQEAIRERDLEHQLESKMKQVLSDFDAPACQYERMGL